MDTVRLTLISGTGIFFTAALIVRLSFWYYCYKMHSTKCKYTASEYELRLSKTMWLYEAMFNICVGAGILYLLQYYGQGFWPKGPMQIGIWGRWLYYTFAGSAFVATMVYVLSPAPYGPQCFNAVLFYALSMFFGMLPATWSQKSETEAVWVSMACFFFYQCITRLFWPINKIFGDALYYRAKDVNFSETPTAKLLFRPETRQHEANVILWGFILRVIFLVTLVLTHLGMLVTWLLSDSQNFSDTSDLPATLISNLVLDALFILPIVALLAVLTASGAVRLFSVVDLASGHKHIEAQVST